MTVYSRLTQEPTPAQSVASDTARRMAARWHESLAEKGRGARPVAIERDDLAQLVDRMLALLPGQTNVRTDDREETDAARDVGRDLATLGFLGAEVLERSHIILAETLSESAAAARLDLPPARLLRLMAAFASGFTEALHIITLREQEEVRRANLRSLEAAQLELHRSHEQLARLNASLIHELGERSLMEAALRDYAARLENLQEVAVAILSAGGLDEVIRLAVEHVQRQISCTCASVALFDPQTMTSTVLYSNCPGSFTGMQAPVTRLDLLEQARAGESIYLPDMLALENPSPGLQLSIDAGLRSQLNVPLRFQEELLGGLAIYADEVRAFSAEEQAIVREIANVLAIAIQNGRLLAGEQEARQRETVLREVSRSVTAGLRLEEVLEQILNQLDRVVRSEGSSIFLRRAEGVEVAAQRARALVLETMRGVEIERLAGLSSVLRTAQPVLIPDTRTWPNWLVLKGGEDIRGWLGIPLTVRDELIGVVTLDRTEPGTFTRQDADLALAFASQAAIAIENARLFEQVERHAEELENRVRERTRRLEMLYRISAATGDNVDLRIVLRHSLAEVHRAFPDLVCTIHLLDQAGELALATFEGSAEGDDDSQLALLETIRLLPVSDALLGCPLALHSAWVAAEPDLEESEAGRIAGGYVAAPLLTRGRPVGVLSLFGPDAAAFSDEDLSLLGAVADQIAVAVETTSLRQRIRQTAIMEERERLAQELHDVVTQSLYSLILFTDAAQDRLMVKDMAAVNKNLQSISYAAQQALGEMRLLLFDLRSDALAVKGLANSLRERLSRVEERAGITTGLVVEGVGELPPELEDVYYRVALEALNNALRHAEADDVRIRLSLEDRQLLMRISDNGTGFDLVKGIASGGQGLASMRNRAESIGGILQVTADAGVGTVVELRAPVGKREPR